MPLTLKKARRGRPTEPGSYQSAADAADCSVTHAYQVIKYDRPCSPATREAFAEWARERKRNEENSSEAARLAIKKFLD